MKTPLNNVDSTVIFNQLFFGSCEERRRFGVTRNMIQNLMRNCLQYSILETALVSLSK